MRNYLILCCVFIFDSYATRKGKGTHRAVEKAQAFLKKNRWFLKADIRKYFKSVDHGVLLEIIRRKIKDGRFLEIIERIIRIGGESGKGIPIGNLTSQFFANVYLDPLRELRNGIEGFLEEYLALSFNRKATFINQRLNGFSFLGKGI